MIKKFVSNSIFSSNVYVINDKNTVILIDPGFYDNELKGYLKKLGKLDAILLTHGHFDHIHAVDEIKKDYPDAKVYISKEDFDFLTNPDLNLSYIMRYNLLVKSEVNIIKGNNLNIGTFDIDVIPMPGHTNGSVMYYFKDKSILYTGDTIMKDTIGTTRYIGGSEEEMKNSIKKFTNLNLKSDTLIYPGHGEEATYKYIIKDNMYINDCKLLDKNLIKDYT